MNRSFPILLLGLGLIIYGMTGATAAGGGSKIGFVDLEKTLLETKVGKKASAKFERARKRKQGELDKKKKTLEASFRDLEKKRSVMKRDVWMKKRAAIEKEYVQLQQLFMKLERDLAGERAKLIKSVLDKAAPVIKQIAKEDGFSVILDRNAVAWGQPGLDITAKVNKRVR